MFCGNDGESKLFKPMARTIGFDLETTQSALTDKPLLVQKYHYGGLALRGPVAWLTEKDGDVTEVR
jgi:hypothetical protein